ncbi:lipocalin [Salipiger sp.]|uniref:lipocalin n=1 Tax=Salipiger sp. TaxID=2078585 RepID=UPI003A97931A
MRTIKAAVGGAFLLACLGLAGCAPSPELPRAAIPLRNPTAPVASQANATLERLQGRWVVVQGAGLTPGAALAFDGDRVTIDGAALPVRDLSNGRFGIAGDELWVHWLDADDRTAAIGDPGGARVWIMDRTGAPRERLDAAREILDWYGYDLGRLAGG